jgi:UDP:flavonoid glycosyltransferase YjiC (YdhE family)
MTTSDRKRVLFFGESTSLSHVVRPTVLAQALPPSRYEAILACDPRFLHLFGDLSVRVVRISSLPVAKALENVYLGLPLLDPDTLDRYVQEDLRVLREFTPDLVVGDLRQSLAVSSRLLGIPYLNISNAQWSPFASVDFELAEHPVIDIIGDPIAQVLFKAFFPVGSFFHSLPLNVIRMKYGLPWISIDYREQFLYGDYAVYPDVPELVPTRTLPETHAYIGPIIWSAQVEPPDWWDQVPQDRPVVYVNLGSSGQQRLLETLLHALAQMPVYVIAATASRAEVRDTPANAFLGEYLPGLEAARRSQLVICNGGTMSAQQALSAGAPTLGVVSNMDQLVFSKAISSVGAGEVLRERNASQQAFKSIVSKMLSQNSYKQSAERIEKIYRNYNAPERFIAFVDKILQREEM